MSRGIIRPRNCHHAGINSRTAAGRTSVAFCAFLWSTNSAHALNAPGLPLEMTRSRKALGRRRHLDALRMVLTTPESVIEQASTEKLLDDLIDESVRTSARRPIMMQFNPQSGWIWKRWKGTVFSETWDSCAAKMVYASIVFLICKKYPQVKEPLSGINLLWSQLLSVTTFTLTFFVNQSYSLWRKCYELSRRLQGRLQDLDMTLAAHAARKPSADANAPSVYTAGSRQLLELIGRYVRIFNLLTYASFTRSHRPILTPRGMRRLVERGLLTPMEREVLIDAEIPATQRHNAVLLWITRAFVEGREAGHFLGGAGFEAEFMEKIHVTRAQYGGIADELAGRMPLAYAHIVQVLVDVVLWMYPLMAFSSGMSGILGVLGTGFLTVSYQGLFDLAKQFLDPYDNESYGKGEDPLVVDTLIAETNSASVRWMHGLEEMPVPYKRIKEADLSDMLLPLRGYSVEELAQMEQEKLQKEKEMQEKRQREENERRRLAEQQKKRKEAAEAMIPALINGSMDKQLNDSMKSLSPVLLASGDREASQTLKANSIAVSPLSLSSNIATFVNEVSNISGAIPLELVPVGTALVKPIPYFGQKTKDEHQVLPGEPRPSTIGSIEEQITFPAIERLEQSEDIISQILADEVWNVELEPVSLAERSPEEIDRAVDEILEAEKLETEAILKAPPLAEFLDVPLKEKGGAKLVNATKGEMGELSILEMDSLDNLTTTGSLAAQVVDPLALAANTTIPLNSPHLSDGVEGERSGPIYMNEWRDAGVKSGQREEKGPGGIVRTEDEILEAEKLETEAILKAPPLAEFLDVPSMEKGGSRVDNATKSEIDELFILEMDDVDNLTNRSALETVQIIGNNAGSLASSTVSESNINGD